MNYLLTNISRKPLIVLDRTLASSLTATDGLPGSVVVSEADLSDYSIMAYLSRGHIKKELLDKKGRVVIEKIVVEEVEETQVVEEPVVETVVETAPEPEVVEDTSSEPTADMYLKEDLEKLSSSELRAILSSFGESTRSKKKTVLIKKIMEAQDV